MNDWSLIVKHRLLFAVVAALLAAAGFRAGAARAAVELNVTQGNVKPVPIAVTDFAGTSPGAGRAGQEIAQVIRGDLSGSGLFRSIDPASFVEQPHSPDVPPRFGDWRVINAQALVTGGATVEADGRLKVEFRLWDVFAEQQMTGFAYYTLPENARRVGHMVADKIYERLTGEKGYFDTRIVYVAESGPLDRRVKRLAIMDQDGANNRYLTDGSSLVLTPRFNPTAQEITYMSYYGGRPRVYLLNLETGQQEVLGDFPSMTFSPRFSPSGNSVIMSLSNAGNSDIYVMDLRSRHLTRLTNNPAIDTSPCYSPDSKQIVFNSDRGGSQQLYIMNADGSGAHRISFGEGHYGTPAWSPRGDLIAFTKIRGGRFAIGVMKPDGSGERILTESFLDEGPTWAPNGRVIMFFRQTPSNGRGRGGSSRLWSVDLTGYNLREVLTPTDASDPAWSPLLD